MASLVGRCCLPPWDAGSVCMSMGRATLLVRLAPSLLGRGCCCMGLSRSVVLDPEQPLDHKVCGLSPASAFDCWPMLVASTCSRCMLKALRVFAPDTSVLRPLVVLRNIKTAARKRRHFACAEDTTGPRFGSLCSNKEALHEVCQKGPLYASLRSFALPIVRSRDYALQRG